MVSFVMGATDQSTHTEFSRRLSLLAQVAGSQNALARKAGVPQGQISHFIRGRREPVLSTLIKLARGAGVSVAWLIGEERKAA